jgi:hypothetical protein
MRRRPARSGTPLNDKQSELARRESEVRNQMQQLERAIADAPKIAEENSRRQREELLLRAREGRNRLDVSVSLHDKRWGDDGLWDAPRRPLRKSRREGRIMFIVLVIALFAIAVWLAGHLHF